MKKVLKGFGILLLVLLLAAAGLFTWLCDEIQTRAGGEHGNLRPGRVGPG